MGLALGLQGYNTLTRFGAEESLGALVGLSLIRELGPVLTALLVTGRAGSAIASEIGSMVATEQLDGLRMMSVDPVDFVAAPKAAAMVFVLPLLSALFIVFGLFGGWLIGVQVLGIDHGAFIGGLESAIDFSDDILGSLVKALVFGILIGLVSTYRGYTAAPNVEGVSRATTGAVVHASVGTLIFDYFITALWGSRLPTSPIRDLLVGAFVLAGIAAIAYLSVQLGARAYTGEGGLILTAAFDEVGGLSPRAPVVIGGVTVGQVRDIRLDPEQFRAIVEIDIDAQLKIPDDSAASILTQGVLGDQYIALEPGGSPDLLESGSEIAYTQSAVVLERLIGKLLQSFGGAN